MPGTSSGAPTGEAAPVIGAGWRWIYTRGYDLAAPAAFAFSWIVQRAPTHQKGRGREAGSREGAGAVANRPTEHRSYPHGIERVTGWEVIAPDRIIFHDTILKKGRVEILGEEIYRFLGGTTPGCIVEVTVLRKPISLVSRMGFALWPDWSIRSKRRDIELLREIEEAYRFQR
jgi:hypothetical protein